MREAKGEEKTSHINHYAFLSVDSCVSQTLDQTRVGLCSLFVFRAHAWIIPCWTVSPPGRVMDPIVEVVALVLGFLGWVLAGVCLPNRYWRTSTVDGNVITTSTIYENLWMSCATDSTGVHNCREFPSLLALNGTSQNPPQPPNQPEPHSTGGKLIYLLVVRLHPSVSCIDDHLDSAGHLWTGGRLDRSTMLQSWRGKLCP